MGHAELAPGSRVEVYVSPDEQTGEVSLGLVREVFLRVRRDEPSYRRESARWVLETYNGFWKRGGRDLTVAGYVKRIEPDTVWVRADGSVKLSYLAGELFRGHGIGVWVSPDGRVERAEMSG
jgi:hypothetical protein